MYRQKEKGRDHVAATQKICQSKVESSEETSPPALRQPLQHILPVAQDQTLLSHRQQNTVKVVQGAQSYN